MVWVTIDVTIGYLDWSSPGQGHQNGRVSVSPTLFPASFRFTWARVKIDGITRKVLEVLNNTCISKDLWSNGSSLSSTMSMHHHEEEKKPWGDWITTNVDPFLLLSQKFVNWILVSAKANIRELGNYSLESLTI
jgi:hypothetical protein